MPKIKQVVDSVKKLLGRYNLTSTEPEFNSGIPVEMTVHQERPLSIEEMVQRYVRTTISAAAEDDDADSFEEADDFEEEDPDVIDLTHHQVLAMSDDEVRDYASNYGVSIPEAPQESTPPPASGEAPGVTAGLPPKPSPAVTSATNTPPTL